MAKRGAIIESLGQLHLGEIVPDRQQQRLEHGEGSPGRLARRGGSSSTATGFQSISPSTSSREEEARDPTTKPSCS